MNILLGRWLNLTRYYEPRLKVQVPSNPPKYLVKAFECYTRKMEENQEFGIHVCKDSRLLKCRAWEICRMFAEISHLTIEVLKEKGYIKV